MKKPKHIETMEERERIAKEWEKSLITVGKRKLQKGELFDRIVFPKETGKTYQIPLAPGEWRLGLSEEKEDIDKISQTMIDYIDDAVRNNRKYLKDLASKNDVLELQGAFLRFAVNVSLDLWLGHNKFRDWLHEEVLTKINYRPVINYWRALKVKEMEIIQFVKPYPGVAYTELVGRIKGGLRVYVPIMIRYLQRTTINLLKNLAIYLTTEERGGKVRFLDIEDFQSEGQEVELLKGVEEFKALQDTTKIHRESIKKLSTGAKKFVRNERQLEILILKIRNPLLTKTEIASKLKVNRKTIKRDFDELSRNTRLKTFLKKKH
jgi:hypothetical protein